MQAMPTTSRRDDGTPATRPLGLARQSSDLRSQSPGSRNQERPKMHAEEVRIFSAHDPVEFERCAREGSISTCYTLC